MSATIAELRTRAGQLAAVSDSPRLDVDLLLCHVLDCDRSYLITWPEAQIDAARVARFDQLLTRRARGEPVAYLLGYREFWSLPLKVSPVTLIPRPETELLVETALARLPDGPITVLDLGTGTGAIALALASERPQWTVIAVDKTAEAVALARDNAERLGLARVRIFQSDWFEQVEGVFDLIVANPPYVDPNDRHLTQGDVRFEPRSALVSAEAGLADIGKIAKQSHAYLAAGGLLLVEHGAEQGAGVRALFESAGLTTVATLPDLAGRDRATLAVRPN